MNRYRNAPTLRGPDKATATTLCQKCLKRDIYECKAPPQERPYIPRPSRTQQLLNPDLVPKLSSDNPNELLRKEGLADELLARREEERGRKEDLGDLSDRYSHSPKRDRSLSVATISTNRSYDSSPHRGKHGANETDRRDDSRSPEKTRKRRYSDSSEDHTGSPQPGRKTRSPSGEPADDRNTRRRRRESSPEERGRHRGSGRHSERRRRRSRSLDKERIKDMRSMTPDVPRDRSYRDRASPPRQFQSGRSRPDSQAQKQEPPRERSLSPFSKRLRLTEAMNHGR
ncbi:uncharacterized protein N7515_000108 [Penicillium bovifimosum]|uniref:Zinc knuckle-domain-containing protein n=1 Tax=Penicillium bovifimosum TaxID=126998 RepID=A0A9W9HEG6_9EURO|nr:uncharacterized protein N7515_000108 [Penicillium bovifimosum]KAJ5145544.1 hypothetical protein N7515_000108 [Penicillium bovifimosum]